MRKGFTLVEVMIVVAIIALLAAIAIPNILRSRVNSNEMNAQTVLKTISTAAENFASANNSLYPANIAALTGATPPYIATDYTAAAQQGYTVACPTFAASGYTCTAVPTTIGTTGNRGFAICTGGTATIDAAGAAPACP